MRKHMDRGYQMSLERNLTFELTWRRVFFDGQVERIVS